MRLSLVVMGLALLVAPAAAQAPKLDDIIVRVNAYLEEYGTQLANVVAEETYSQSVDQPAGETRTLRSDYALTGVGDRGAWVGYRDTFEVDGLPVRDREERLQRLLSGGATRVAEIIAEQNSRFNLGNDLISRNVNVPTFALELIHPRNRYRFRARRTGVDILDGRPGWLVEFRERERPTIVRTPEGRDQESRVVALVDTQSGEVLRTIVTWERVNGSITVSYGRVPTIPVLVPVRMSEHYTTRTGVHVTGEATYTNYRQFQTSGRVIQP